MPIMDVPESDDYALYFAYGSNMCITQMADRCPRSVFLGKAQLHDYRWQINQRGVANVVKSPGKLVRGLAYLVHSTDMIPLDRYEGVSSGLYEQQFLPVELFTHSIFVNYKTKYMARLMEHPDLKGFDLSGKTAKGKKIVTEALVYVSEEFKRDGLIRKEYISRMRKSVNQSLKLGLVRTYLNETLVPHLGDLDEAAGRVRRNQWVERFNAETERQANGNSSGNSGPPGASGLLNFVAGGGPPPRRTGNGNGAARRPGIMVVEPRPERRTNGDSERRTNGDSERRERERRERERERRERRANEEVEPRRTNAGGDAPERRTPNTSTSASTSTSTANPPAGPEPRQEGKCWRLTTTMSRCIANRDI